MSSSLDHELSKSFVEEVAKVVKQWADAGEAILDGSGDGSWSPHAAEYLKLQQRISDPEVLHALAHLIRDIASGTAFSVLTLIDGGRAFPRCDLVTSETAQAFGGGQLHELFSDAEAAEE